MTAPPSINLRQWPRLCLFMGLLMLGVERSAAELEINEFLASNLAGLQDEDGDASDWIELFNHSAAALDTRGYFLTDDPQRLEKWPLPEVTLPAGNFKVVFASGKNRTLAAGEWHANFSLRAAGEYLALTKGGAVVQGFFPTFPAQQADISYGMTPPQFMGHPTPGAANDPAPPGPPPVIIQPVGGTFANSLNVTLTVPTPGGEIRYTTDGSLPTATSRLFAPPLILTATTRLRARAFASGQPGAVTGAVWVRLAASLAGYETPLPIIILENFNAGTVPIKNLGGANGSGSQQVAQQAAAWIVKERVGSTTLMSAPAQIAADIGIRGRGYFSSQWTQKPYSIEPRNAAGETVAVAPLGLPANNDWVLYYPDPGAFKDTSMLHNAFSYQLARNLGHAAAKFRFVEVFLNTNGGDLELADRRGVYLLMEKISRGKERLDFSPLSADGSTGGCLLSFNRMDAIPESGWPAPNGAMTPQFFHTAGPNRLLQTAANVVTVVGDDLPAGSRAFFNFDQPSGNTINSAQRAAVELWFKNFEDVLYDDTKWRDPVLGYRKYLKVKDFLGTYLMHNFVRHSDAMNFSLFPWLGDDRQLRLGPVWDTNTDGYHDEGDPEASLFYHSGTLWFPRLFSDLDFRQDYIDLWTKWRRTGMTDSAMVALIDAQVAEITTAKAVAQGVPSAADWISRITTMKSWVQGRAAFFDASFSPVPTFNLLPVTPVGVAGGNVPGGIHVRLEAEGQPVWHTTDKTDPRLPGGAVAPTASNALEIVLNADTRLTARSLTTGSYPWSGPRVATYAVDAVPATRDDLRISEIQYHPAAPTAAEILAGFTDPDEFEFIELTNIGLHKISLLDVRAIQTNNAGIDFDFSTGSQWTLVPGARLVLAKNPAAMLARYGPSVVVAGAFSGNLANHGDTISLHTSAGGLLQRVTYSDLSPWPTGADGAGFSLTWRGETPDLPAHWRTSLALGGTPGTHDGVAYSGNDPAAWAAYAIGSHPQLILAGRRLTFTPPPGADDADYALESSTDLQTWSPSSWNRQGEQRLPGLPTQLLWSPDSRSITPPLYLRIRAERR